ncbi:hypothetical protein Sango_2808200 [Sesamum angolense]|uniref:Uncharacterized protein n=1 Tax=Sesamum angolense TaxID=2727404 RepID=A0AAE1T7U8_9LAMI|nr:hypothetical protein Sango_2808200 [Sesamum angolense]
MMDLELALREDSPHTLTDKSTSKQKRKKEQWEKSNRICAMILKKSILEAFRGTMSETLTKAKDFLEHIEKRFVKNEKAKTDTVASFNESLHLRVQVSKVPQLCYFFESGYARIYEDVRSRQYHRTPIQETVKEEQTPTPPEPLSLRRSTRERRNDIRMMEDDPINYHQAMDYSNSQKWNDVMNEEIKSMKDNDVQELVQFPHGAKLIGCK